MFLFITFGNYYRSDKELHKRQDMLSNLRSKAKQMASTLNMSNFANRFDHLALSYFPLKVFYAATEILGPCSYYFGLSISLVFHMK